MSLRFRRTLKIAPGIRLNFNKDSVGVSLGPRGAHYTMNSKGRRTISAGIPGSGLYSVETLNAGRRTSRSDAAQQSVPENFVTPAPGLFAGKMERAFNRFLLDIYNHESQDSATEVVEKANALKQVHPALVAPLDLISLLHAAPDDAFKDKIESWCEVLWNTRDQVFSNPLVEKYFTGITPQVHITKGITSNEIYNLQTLGFIYTEILQDAKKYDEALDVLHQMNPDQIVAISIADLEITKGDFDAAIDTTEDIENVDDATAMLLILRGIAFREKGLNDASTECFKRALASKKRAEEMRHRAYFERAETYIRMGKKAMAIKDLERILVDDASYPGVEEKLDSLKP